MDLPSAYATAQGFVDSFNYHGLEPSSTTQDEPEPSQENNPIQTEPAPEELNILTPADFYAIGRFVGLCFQIVSGAGVIALVVGSLVLAWGGTLATLVVSFFPGIAVALPIIGSVIPVSGWMLGYLVAYAMCILLFLATFAIAAVIDRPRTQWSFALASFLFDKVGCSVAGCPYHNSPYNQCALNLSDALIRAGYQLPLAKDVNYCPHGRVRNADGMARVVMKALGRPKVRGWANRPRWEGIVYFAGGNSLSGATGHIDFWNGKEALHATYPDAKDVWFFPLKP